MQKINNTLIDPLGYQKHYWQNNWHECLIEDADKFIASLESMMIYINTLPFIDYHSSIIQKELSKTSTYHDQLFD